MKKIISFSALFLGCFLLAGTAAHAQVISTAQTKAGDAITIPDTNGHGSGLTFAPSPNNLLVATSIESGYTLTSMNAQAPNTQRMEYGIWYNMTGYYQNINPDIDHSPALASDFSIVLTGSDAANQITIDPFAGNWTAIGGGS